MKKKTGYSATITIPLERIWPEKKFKKGEWVYHEFRLFQITGVKLSKSLWKGGLDTTIYNISNGFLLSSFFSHHSGEVFKLSLDSKGISEWFKDWGLKFDEIKLVNQSTVKKYLLTRWVRACHNPKDQENIYKEVTDFFNSLKEASEEFQFTKINDVYPFSHREFCGTFS